MAGWVKGERLRLGIEGTPPCVICAIYSSEEQFACFFQESMQGEEDCGDMCRRCLCLLAWQLRVR